MRNINKYIEDKKKMCFHYRSPIHCESCSKNINYRELVGGERKGYLARLPCVTTNLSYKQVECKSFRPYTSKEAVEEYKKFEELERKCFQK